ncbi:MAG: hypothetical protein WC707_06700 [Candidatus Babeliaceae bacterium]
MNKNIIIHIAILLSCTAYGTGRSYKNQYDNMHLAVINPATVAKGYAGLTLSILEVTGFEIIDITIEKFSTSSHLPPTIMALVKRDNGAEKLREIKEYIMKEKKYKNENDDIADFVKLEKMSTNKKNSFLSALSFLKIHNVKAPILCSTSLRPMITSTIKSHFPHLLYTTQEKYTLKTTTASDALITLSENAIADMKVGEIITKLEENRFYINGIKKAYRIGKQGHKQKQKKEPVVIIALSRPNAQNALRVIQMQSTLGAYITIIRENNNYATFIDAALN